jgi:gas vesicle protein
MSSGKIITSLLAGVAIGAVLGVLFAPEEGSKTRKKILRQKEDFKDSLKDKINDFVDEISQQYESAKNNATDMMEKGKEKIASVKADAKHSLS